MGPELRCVSRINVLTRDPQAAQSPVPSRSESAAKQPPESAHFLPSITIQTSHRDDDDDDTHTRLQFPNKAEQCVIIQKGEAKTLCRKMPPTFCQFKHQFAIVKRRLGREFCGRHAQPCTVCPGFSGGGGFVTTTTQEAHGAHSLPPHPVWRGRGETGHLARSCLSPP